MYDERTRLVLSVSLSPFSISFLYVAIYTTNSTILTEALKALSKIEVKHVNLILCSTVKFLASICQSCLAITGSLSNVFHIVVTFPVFLLMEIMKVLKLETRDCVRCFATF